MIYIRKVVCLIFLLGRGKQHGQPSLVISPDTLILSHFGHVKISKHVGRGTEILHLVPSVFKAPYFLNINKIPAFSYRKGKESNI